MKQNRNTLRFSHNSDMIRADSIPQEKRMAGRPTKYTKALADEFCRRLAEGESVRSICKSDDMPVMATVFRWLTEEDKASFKEQYEKARVVCLESMAEEILEISDDATNDWMEKHDKDGEAVGWQLNGDHVQRSRLRVDARKWLLSKMLPKKYGDKLAIGGADDLPPVQSNVTLDPSEAYKRLLGEQS